MYEKFSQDFAKFDENSGGFKYQLINLNIQSCLESNINFLAKPINRKLF
jgi:hypothetical protein